MKTAANNSKHSTVVLKNNKGQIARTFEMNSSSAKLILRADTRRIELVADTSALDENKVIYSILANVNSRTLTKTKSIDIAGIGKLEKSDDINNLAQDIRLPAESRSRFKEILRWTAIGHFTALLILLLVGYFYVPEKSIDEPQVVTVFKQKRSPITVSPSNKRQKTKARVAKVTRKKRKSQRIVRRSKTKATIKTNKQSVSNMGALNVLGQLGKGKGPGGLNLGAAKTTAGIGRGGSAGSGGTQTTIYSKGIVGAPVGSGNNAYGGGGIGTRGNGGGQAGYGRISLSGAAGRYVQPLEDLASIQGGLDRDQVAEVIRRHQGQIVYCYEKGLQVKPSLKGRIAVKFVIGTKGYVSTAKVSHTSVKSRTVENCIVQRLRGWKFPKPIGDVNVKVEYPFTFKRVSQG